jgi:enoyl-CoA hydratase/carnithine racemase
MALVGFSQRGAVGVITLDSPPLNLLSHPFFQDLDEAVYAAAAAPVRAVLVRTAGRHFGAGADVGDLFAGVRSDQARVHLSRWLGILRRLEGLPVPVVAEVRGMCVGGGFEVALHCDLIVAGETATFGHLEARWGTATLLGGAQRVAERAGPSRAAEMIFGAELYDAPTMREWGVVNRVVADDDLGDGARGLARRLADGPTSAHAMTKRLIRAYRSGGISQADDLLLELAPRIYDTVDMQNGVRILLDGGVEALREHSGFVGR